MTVRALAIPLILAAISSPARAEHARIELEVHAGTESQIARVDQTPPDSGKNPRPVIHVKAGESIKIQWTYTNLYPHKTLDNVLLHWYIAKQAQVGQKEIPNLDDPLRESALRADLKPNAKAGERCKLQIDEPGIYLVRIEGKDSESDHVHFAAIDLVVDPVEPKR